jgi:hypothetical protein
MWIGLHCKEFSSGTTSLPRQSAAQAGRAYLPVFMNGVTRCGLCHFAQAGDQPHTYYNLRRKAGYRTGFIGKYGVGNVTPESDFDYWGGWPGFGRSEVKRDGKTTHLTQVSTEHRWISSTEAREISRSACLSVPKRLTPMIRTRGNMWPSPISPIYWTHRAAARREADGGQYGDHLHIRQWILPRRTRLGRQVADV